MNAAVDFAYTIQDDLRKLKRLMRQVLTSRNIERYSAQPIAGCSCCCCGYEFDDRIFVVELPCHKDHRVHLLCWGSVVNMSTPNVPCCPYCRVPVAEYSENPASEELVFPEEEKIIHLKV